MPRCGKFKVYWFASGVALGRIVCYYFSFPLGTNFVGDWFFLYEFKLKCLAVKINLWQIYGVLLLYLIKLFLVIIHSTIKNENLCLGFMLIFQRGGFDFCYLFCTTVTSKVWMECACFRTKFSLGNAKLWKCKKPLQPIMPIMLNSCACQI